MKPDNRPDLPIWAASCLVVLLGACEPAQEPPAEATAPESASETATTGQDLFDKNCGACHGPGPEWSNGLLAVLILVNVIDCLSHRLDLLRGVIRNRDVELFLEFHDQLYRVERVGSEVVDE